MYDYFQGRGFAAGELRASRSAAIANPDASLASLARKKTGDHDFKFLGAERGGHQRGEQVRFFPGVLVVSVTRSEVSTTLREQHACSHIQIDVTVFSFRWGSVALW